MSPEAKLMWIMIGSLLGVGACALIDWIVRKRIEREQDERTDELMRRGMHAISAEEIDELLSRPSRQIEPADFQVVERGRPLNWEHLS